MSDQPTPVFGVIQIAGQPVALSPIPLQVIFFDDAPTVNHLNGIIGVTLTVTGNVPVAGGSPHFVGSVATHLKCTVAGAKALISSLQSGLLLAQPVEKPDGPAN